MITDRIGQHKVLLPVNHNNYFKKIWDIRNFFKSKHKKFQDFFYCSEKKSFKRVWWYVPSNYLGMMHTVLLDYPIKVEISAVDSQSDLRILL